MAKISDKIRKWCGRNDFDARGNFVAEDSFIELCCLADRIDSEMVELPQSADGKIWTGREVCFWTNAEQEGYHSFGCVALRNGKWHVEDTDGMDYEAESVWYERPDSLERIAKELEGLSVDSSDNYYVSTHCSKLAERIRKLEMAGVDGHGTE